MLPTHLFMHNLASTSVLLKKHIFLLRSKKTHMDFSERRHILKNHSIDTIDITFVYHVFNNIVPRLRQDTFFKKDLTNLRRHNLRFKKELSCLDLRRDAFNPRFVNTWNA